MTAGKTPAECFGEVGRELASGADTPLGDARGFGANALKHQGKIFAMLHDNRLVVKLTAPPVAELIDTNQGLPFHGSGGRPMREWVAVALEQHTQWLALSQAALAAAMTRNGRMSK